MSLPNPKVVPFLRAALTSAPAQTVVPGYAPAALPVPMAPPPDPFAGLAGYVRKCFEAAKTARQTNGVDDRMMAALRAMRGEYDAATLADIKQFGGSEVYARITASKVRGTSALLREIYTSTDRPYALEPSPVPSLPGQSVVEAIETLIAAEVAEAQMTGQPVPEDVIAKRRSDLREQIMEAQHKIAQDALRQRESAIDDVLWEGNFYAALWEFLGDVACFPYAVLKGPVVRMQNVMRWENGVPQAVEQATMQWERCSPFDVFFAPWAQHPQDGYIIHRYPIAPVALRALRDLPSYSAEKIDEVLELDPDGMHEWFDYTESERADLEQRDSRPLGDTSGSSSKPYPMVELHDSIKGQLLLDWGMTPEQVTDPGMYFNCTVFMVGGHVIGVRKNPHPLGRKGFYVDSFERVPGSPHGHGIPDLIGDIQGVTNAALRALCNNLAIASGPMGFVNEDQLAENDQDATRLWPWKMFRTTDSMMGSTVKPVEFFQPNSNAQELLAVYQNFAMMADEMSSLPRYMQGNAAGVGGAGRTASGLSMLMEASNRTIKQTVASIDQNVIEQVVQDLNVYLALTRPDIVMEGDLSVRARGAVELVQRETLRMRRLEFLQITTNPVDMQLTGLQGRQTILKEIARDLGLPTGQTLPNDAKALEAAQQAAMAMPAGGPGGGPSNGNPAQGVARPAANNPGIS
ncbi:MAG: portal protein [Silanimonas sp.]